MKNNQNKTNILSNIQDKSITNILTFILNQNGYNLIDISKQPNFYKTNYSAIILDDPKDKKSLEAFIKIYKKHLKSTPIIKAISHPSKSQLSSIYKNQIIATIYKPFDTEEFLTIIKDLTTS